MGFESSEQDVAVDPLAGDGLQDFVLVSWTVPVVGGVLGWRLGCRVVGLVAVMSSVPRVRGRAAHLLSRWVGWPCGTGLRG